MENGITDLSWVNNSREENKGRYVCVNCSPMQYMNEVTDPKLTEFLGHNRHRYICPKCGDTYDSSDPMARMEEMLTPLSGTENDDSNNTRKSKQFFFESFSHANRNDVHGTKFGRQYFQQQAESSKLLDIDDDSDIREMGVQITRSSVTGKTHVKEYK